MQTLATTRNIVGPNNVVSCCAVLADVCKRSQQVATCWVRCDIAEYHNINPCYHFWYIENSLIHFLQLLVIISWYITFDKCLWYFDFPTDKLAWYFMIISQYHDNYLCSWWEALLGGRDENKTTLLIHKWLLFQRRALFKREVYSRVIVFLELKAKRRLRYNLNACGFLLSSSSAP